VTRPSFTSTHAVVSSRRHAQYISCPACASRLQRYQFHRAGVRFVRCQGCALVYADPVDPADRGYFDIQALGQHDSPVDRSHLKSDFADLTRLLSAQYQHRFHRPPRTILLAGRWHESFLSALPEGVALDLCTTHGVDETRLVTRPLTHTLGASISRADIVLLNEFLDAVPQPVLVLQGLAEHLQPEAIVAVTFANMSALPSRALRRRWKPFFDKKVAFYSAENLNKLMWRVGFRRFAHERLKTTYSSQYLAARLELPRPAQRWASAPPLSWLHPRFASGREVTLFTSAPAPSRELLSIIVPVYNEELYVGEVISGLLAQHLPVEREIIVVESGSTDASREIVSRFQETPGVRVIYQDKPRGKGNAVRAALKIATGTILLIQDADFEYDLDDYDALLEPILRRRASFVLGSRSLGLDDWKVRQYGDTRVKAFLLNLAQVAFAKTFNALYQQRTTDINTMLKVFRRECLDGCHLVRDGFDFDIELVCKLVRNGFEPMEVPVNYLARGFAQGKKINFLVDAYPSYYQLFRWRFGRL
jgi:hypothetical protein